MRRAVPLLLLLTLGHAGVSAATTLTGRLSDAARGHALADARVSLAGRDQATTSSPAGTFVLEVDTWPATVVATCSGYRLVRLDLEAAPREPIEIALEPVVSWSDRIEVTATRAREGFDPATVTNIPAERVAETYWGQDPALLVSQLAPGFLAYNDSGNGIGYSYFTVRGFGQARTRVTLNGAPLNDAESGELFFVDLADFLSTAGDVQLGRGVFGLSGIGGSLDITTVPSSLERAVTFSAGAGSFGTRRASVRFDSGLVGGRFAVVARASRIETDGYRDQSWVEMWNGFLSISRFGTRSTLRFVSFGGPERTHLAYDGIPRSVLEGGTTGDAARDRRTNPIAWPGEVDRFTQPHFQLLHDLTLGAATRLSQTFYAFRGDGSYEQLRTRRTLAEYNLPDAVLADGTAAKKSDLVRRRNVVEWDYGWVPTLTQRRSAFTWTLTGELRLHDAHHEGIVKWAQFYPAGVAPDRRYYDYEVGKHTATGAARLAWEAHPRLTLSAGLQLTRERYRMSNDRVRDVSLEKAYGFVLPRAGAVVHLGREIDAYVNVARGGRAPGFRQIYDPQDYYAVVAPNLDPEDVIDYEAGLSLRRGTWHARLNAFFMDFRNEIVYAGALDDNGVPVYGNGARARHRGVEAETSWNPRAAFGVDANVTLSRNAFTEYREHDWEGGVLSHDGNRIAGYPDVMATLTLRGALGPARLLVSGRHAGRFYLDNSEDNRRQPALRASSGYVPRVNAAYSVVDAALRVALPAAWTRAVRASRVELELRAQNLLDRRYTAFGYVDGEPLFIPAATRGLYSGITVGF